MNAIFLLNLGQEARRDKLSVSLVELNFQTVNISY